MNREPEPEPTPFLSLLQLLATHAMAALGAGGPNERNEVYLDLDFAAHVIDILHDLDEKTKGRRTADEDTALAETVSALQLSFVRMSDLAMRAARAGGTASTPAGEGAAAGLSGTQPAGEVTSAGAGEVAQPSEPESERQPRFHKKYD